MLTSCALFLIMSAVANATSPPSSGTLASAAEAMWQLPSNSPPRGLFFLAHGCSHSATDFFFPPTLESKCLALPEEVKIVDDALKAGYAVLAISSNDRDTHRCWVPETDGPIVKEAIAKFISDQGLPATLPIVALGASSGGAFVLMLPALVPQIKAVVSQIMGIPPGMLPDKMPPTQFVHMTRDQRTAALVHKDAKKLKQSGVSVSIIDVEPQKPTADFFSRKIPRLSAETAAQLHGALKKGGLLDGNGFLAADPRGSSWREAMESSAGIAAALPGPHPKGPPDTLRSDESAVSEVLNVAWARHEIVADTMAETLRWLEAVVHGKGAGGGPAAPAGPVELRRA